jgi:hypothetical protein
MDTRDICQLVRKDMDVNGHERHLSQLVRKDMYVNGLQRHLSQLVRKDMDVRAYFNLYLNEELDSLSCPFTSISFLTN